jgi:hypothetical protein
MAHTPFHAVLAVFAFAIGCGGAVETSHDGGTDDDGGSHEDAGSPGTPGCNLVMIEPPILTVTDRTTGQKICDAVSEGDGGATLYPCGKDEEGCSGTCQYTVMDDGSGSTFTVEIDAPGYAQTTVSGLETRYCGCDEKDCQAAQQVTASLVPITVLPAEDAGASDSGAD